MRLGLLLVVLILTGGCAARPGETALRADLAPVVFEASDEEMARRLCGARAHECSKPLALHSEGKVYVRQGFDPSDPRQLGVLVHEFTHFLQYIGGLKLCRGEKERQAYAVQRTWLAENGLTPQPTVDFPGPVMLAMLTRCEWSP